MKWMFVYILECSDGAYYTGVTNNLELRIQQHDEGIHTDSYTYSRRPVKLVFNQMYDSAEQAFYFEKKIKRWSKAKKKALADGQYELLP